jgi:hypothetical protein
MFINPINNTQEETLSSSQPAAELTLYALVDNEGKMVSVNNRKVHLTRKDVREARIIYNRRNVKIVKGKFTLGSGWTPVR